MVGGDMKIGLIGVGNIGFHFANRLIAAGYELYIYDKSQKALERLSKSGAKICASAKDLASEVETVLLCLPMPQIVADVAADVAQGSRVKVVVDLSTTGPSVTKQVAVMLEKHNIPMIGSPVKNEWFVAFSTIGKTA
jgi:3-hydroxyisobutyrate dehydrogenase